MTTTKTTRSLRPGDVLIWGDLRDRVVAVTPVPNSVLSRVAVSRRFDDGKTVPTFFYAGNDAAHELSGEEPLMGYDMYARGEMKPREDGGEDNEPGYFRLNIFGMSQAREELWPIGIVRGANSPEVPMAADFGVEDSFDFEDSGVELTPDQQRYTEALTRWRSGNAGDAPGIPIYKLGSNDGWVVNHVEVTSGVGFADANFPGWRDALTDYVREFVEWAERCVEGFEVW